MAVEVEVKGLEFAATKVGNLEVGVKDFSDPFERAINDIYELEGQIFMSQGRGAWASLAPSTVARKGFQLILVETGALRASVTSKTPHTVAAIDGTTLRFGTTLPYAAYLAAGTRRMPARPFLPTSDEIAEIVQKRQREYMMKIIAAHVFHGGAGAAAKYW